MAHHEDSTSGQHSSIIDRVLLHAATSPERIAVDAIHRTTAYAELLGSVGRVAARLKTCPDGPVIVQPNDAVDLAVGCLAALTRARTFLVVDRNVPQDALEVFATSVGSSVLLRPADAANDRPPPDLMTVVDVGVAVAGTGSTALARVQARDVPMAFASTSGSTGRPKLVSILERDVLLVLDGSYGDADLLPSDVPFFPLSPATFTVVGLLRGLALGLTTVCADPRAMPLSDIVKGIMEAHVTFVRVAPSVLRRLVRCIPEGVLLPSIRTIQCTGEPLLWSDVESLRRVLPPSAIVHNRLGMTETGELTIMPVRVHDPIDGKGAVPVGMPLPGRRVRILDPNGDEAVPGVDGEIVFEGDFHRVAEGMETLPDGSTRFQTGDVGCIDASGALLLRGRSDRMLKINGVRVEPSLVEDAIRGLPHVVDVAVIPVSVTVGERRLAALVVTAPGSAITVERIREVVHVQVSAAAVPVRIVLSSEPLPLLESGKSDLRRLNELLDVGAA
jgi:acyl-coenzyme A synthetase/AMP-(fatty) acid ligase